MPGPPTQHKGVVYYRGDAADAQCGAIFCLEINEGAARMSSKEFVDEYGATAACNLRLSKEYHYTGRAWGGDSWFMGVSEVEALCWSTASSATAM